MAMTLTLAEMFSRPTVKCSRTNNLRTKEQAYCTMLAVDAVYSVPVCPSLLAKWTGRRRSILAVLMIDSP